MYEVRGFGNDQNFDAIPRVGIVQKILKNLILAFIQEEKLCNENLIHSNWSINETMPSHTRFSLSGNIYTAGVIPLCLGKGKYC